MKKPKFAPNPKPKIKGVKPIGNGFYAVQPGVRLEPPKKKPKPPTSTF